jgi:predicted O-methyltransferase YrrM
MKIGPDYDRAIDYIADIYRETDKPSMDGFAKDAAYDRYDPTIEDDIARVFKFILHILKPKRILEIGTSIGFSTTILAKVAKQYGGKVISVDIDPKVTENARTNFEREGVADAIEIVLGDAQEVISKFDDESFDVVFQDSAKELYAPMLDDCLRVLKRGGVLLVDDTLFPVLTPKSKWDDGDRGIDKFNHILLEHGVESTLLPIGEGCTVAVKK